MGSLIRRNFAVLAVACIALFSCPAQLMAQSDGFVDIHHPPSLGPLASGASGSAVVFTNMTPPDGGYGGPTYSDLTWTWSATGASGLTLDMSSSAQNPTLIAKVSPPGYYTITLKVTATWTVSTGDTVSASTEAEVDLIVVGVQKLQIMVGKGVYADITGVMYIPVGQSQTFWAVPTPDGETYPTSQPAWSGTAGATGTGDTVSVTFSTVSKSEADFLKITATYGDTSVTEYAIVYDAPAPYVPVTVAATDGTFSPDPTSIGTWVDATLKAKATRPDPGKATLGSPTWSWNVVDAYYSAVSATGPWTAGSGYGLLITTVPGSADGWSLSL